MTKLGFVAAFIVLLAAAPAFSQPWGWGSGWNNDRWGYHAATVGESRANGMANVVQSKAWANKTNSEAALNLTEVRSQQLDNRAKTASTYFSMRNANREQRFGTPEEKAAHRAANQERFARHMTAGDPKRPTAQQLDPITGQINWPFSLMSETFEPFREEIQKVFAERAKQGGTINYQEYEQFKKSSDEMLAALNAEIKNINPMDYISAKQFITQLSYVIQQQAGA